MATMTTSMNIKATNNPKNLPYQMYAVAVQDVRAGQKHPVYQICKKLIFTKNGKSVSSYMAATPDEMKKSAGTQSTLNVINVANNQKMVIGLPAFAQAPFSSVQTQTTTQQRTVTMQPAETVVKSFPVNPDHHKMVVSTNGQTVNTIMADSKSKKPEFTWKFHDEQEASKISNIPKAAIGSPAVSQTTITPVHTQTTNVLAGNQIQPTTVVPANADKVVVCTSKPLQTATGTSPVQLVLSPQVANQTKLANGNLQILRVGGNPIKSEPTTLPVKHSSSLGKPRSVVSSLGRPKLGPRLVASLSRPKLVSITQTSSLSGTQLIQTVPASLPTTPVKYEPLTKGVVISRPMTSTASPVGSQPLFMTISPAPVVSSSLLVPSSILPHNIASTGPQQPVRVILTQPTRNRNVMITVPSSQIKMSHETNLVKSINPPMSPITVYASGTTSPKVSAAITPIARHRHDLSKLLTPPPTPEIDKMNACTLMPANSNKVITIGNAYVPTATILTKQSLSNVAKVQPIVPVAIMAATNTSGSEAEPHGNDSPVSTTTESYTNDKNISDTDIKKCDDKPMFTIDSVFSLSETSANDLFPEAGPIIDEQQTPDESKPAPSVEGAGVLPDTGVKIKDEPPDTGYEKALQVKKEPLDTGYDKALLGSNAAWQATSSDQSETPGIIDNRESKSGTPEVVDFQYPMLVTPSVTPSTPGEPMRWTVQTSPPQPPSTSSKQTPTQLLMSSTQPQTSSKQPSTSSTQLLASSAQPLTPRASTQPLMLTTQTPTSSTQLLVSSAQPLILQSSTRPLMSTTQTPTSSTHLVVSSAHPMTSSTQLLVSSTRPMTSSTQLLVSSTRPMTSSTQQPLTTPTIIKTSAPLLNSVPIHTSKTILMKTLANLKAASTGPNSGISAYYVKGSDGKTGLLQIHSASAKLSEIAHTAKLDSQKPKLQSIIKFTPPPPKKVVTEPIGKIKSIIPEKMSLVDEIIIKQEKTDDTPEHTKQRIIFTLPTVRKYETQTSSAPTRVLRKRKQDLPALSETHTTDSTSSDPPGNFTDDQRETIQEERIRKLKELLKTKTAALEVVRNKSLANVVKKRKLSDDDEDTESADESS